MAAQSHAMPADIRVLHMNIVKKIKISKSFETPFFGLKRCLAVSMTFLHSDNTIFWKFMWVDSLRGLLSPTYRYEIHFENHNSRTISETK